MSQKLQVGLKIDKYVLGLGFWRHMIGNEDYFINHDDDGFYVFQPDEDHIQLWKLHRTEYDGFFKYLDLSKSNFNSINGFSVLIGLGAAVFIYGITYSITKDSYLSSIATIVGDGAVVVATQYFFKKLRENDIKNGNEKYAPIATGSQALKKLAEIYPAVADV